MRSAHAARTGRDDAAPRLASSRDPRRAVGDFTYHALICNDASISRRFARTAREVHDGLQSPSRFRDSISRCESRPACGEVFLNDVPRSRTCISHARCNRHVDCARDLCAQRGKFLDIEKASI
jgi:hypothetical protein